jgi:phage-related holin
VTPVKAMVSFCITGFFLLFGTDHTAITIALIMLGVDTITGGTAALMHSKFTSSGFWRVIPKFIAIVSAFIVGNLLVIFQPEIGQILEYGIASVIIIAEATSILENVAKIHPDFSMKKIIQRLKAIK